MSSRRMFIGLAALSGIGVLGAGEVIAADAPVLDQKDPQAVALGYGADATKVDKTKYPYYAAGQMCSTCQLYQGRGGAAMGPCPLYGGKQVAATGWCSAYAKKAG